MHRAVLDRGHPGRSTEQDAARLADHAAVADDEDGLVRVSRDLGKDLCDALALLLQRLAAREAEVQGSPTTPRRPQARRPRGRRRAARPTRRRPQRAWGRAGEKQSDDLAGDLSGLQRAPQGLPWLAGSRDRRGRRRARVPALAAVVQGRVAVTLEAPRGVLVGLPVAGEEDAVDAHRGRRSARGPCRRP